MSGRPRKPDELHILEGTFRRDKYGNDQPAAVADGEPVMPRDMKGEARKLWNSVVPGLIETGLAKARDTAELVAMCQAWARYVKLVRMFDRLPTTHKQFFRTLAALATASKAFENLAGRFGMSPVDRARIRGGAGPAKPPGLPSRKRAQGGAGTA